LYVTQIGDSIAQLKAAFSLINYKQTIEFISCMIVQMWRHGSYRVLYRNLKCGLVFFMFESHLGVLIQEVHLSKSRL